jgi:hypothetical protein
VISDDKLMSNHDKIHLLILEEFVK